MFNKFIQRIRSAINNKAQPGSMRETILIALPMIASSACDTMMIFIDRLFLAKVGTHQMNAAMLGGMTAFLMSTFFVGLLGYSTAIVAQYYGSRHKEKCSIAIFQAILMALASYPIILLLKPVTFIIFDKLHLAPEQTILQKEYASILITFTFIGLLRQVITCFFSGIGKTKFIMFSTFIAMLVNITLNYILIFGKFGVPAMGIKGAAYGTVIGTAASTIILFAVYLSKHNVKEYSIMKSFKINRKIALKHLRFGYPAGLEFMLNFAAFNAMLMCFHADSPLTATAITITFNWDLVSFVPLIGVEIAVTSLVGRYMGAGRVDYAHKATMSALKLGWIYSSMILILFLTMSNELAELFRPAENAELFMQAQPIAAKMIKLASFYVMVEAAILAYSGALRGAGDTFWTMCISVGIHWLLIAVTLIAFKVFNATAVQAWLAVIVVFMLFGLAFFLRYRTGKWKKIQVIDR